MTRLAILFLLLLAWPTEAAASPTTDGTSVGGNDQANDPGTHTSVSTTPFTTFLSPDIVVAAISISDLQGSVNTISTVTGGGLTFVRRKQYANNMGSNCASLDVNPCSVNNEVWEAVAAAPVTAQVFTAVYSQPLCPAGINNGCRASIVVFAVNGVGSIVQPHDPNVSLPNANTNATDVPLLSGTYTTTKANDLLLWYYGSAATGTGACGANPRPLSPLWSAVGASGIGSHCMSVAKFSVSSTVNTTYGATFDSAAWNIVGDAFTSDAPPPPPARHRTSVWINE